MPEWVKISTVLKSKAASGALSHDGNHADASAVQRVASTAAGLW